MRKVSGSRVWRVIAVISELYVLRFRVYGLGFRVWELFSSVQVPSVCKFQAIARTSRPDDRKAPPHDTLLETCNALVET